MLPTKNYVDRPKTKSVNEDNSQNMYFFYKKHDFTNLIFGKGGDANVKLCIQHFLSLGLSPTPLGNLFKKM
jgi:hypothetical protein